MSILLCDLLCDFPRFSWPGRGQLCCRPRPESDGFLSQGSRRYTCYFRSPLSLLVGAGSVGRLCAWLGPPLLTLPFRVSSSRELFDSPWAGVIRWPVSPRLFQLGQLKLSDLEGVACQNSGMVMSCV